MGSENQIELVDGPLDGTCHELRGRLVPARIELPDENFSDNGIRHCYEIRDDHKGYFIESKAGDSHE